MRTLSAHREIRRMEARLQAVCEMLMPSVRGEGRVNSWSVARDTSTRSPGATW
jgi:hypothetical protein